MTKERSSLGIYVHIPFCLKKCNYCDFVSFPIANYEKCIDEYIDRVCNEVEKTSQVYRNKYLVDTIYFGGGTPSALASDFVGRILLCIKKNYDIRSDAEISIELNPETVTENKAGALKGLGFNRVSMGVQSLNDDVLMTLGRVHNSAKAQESYKILRNAGFENINLDMMLGVPGQNFEVFASDFEKILSMEPEHISFYGLQIEEGTPFYRDYKNGNIDIPSWEENRKMYHYAVGVLKERGYHHYEVSNASKPGFECRHNLKYWTMMDYLGFGTAAHSYIEGQRFYNTDGLDYHREYESVSDGEMDAEREADRIFTGLRLIDGTDFGEVFCGKYENVIKEMIGDGYIKKIGSTLSFTEKGLDSTNIVIGRFLNV